MKRVMKKETKKGFRYYEIKENGKLAPIKAEVVRELKDLLAVEVVDAEGVVLWSPKNVERTEADMMVVHLNREYKNMDNKEVLEMYIKGMKEFGNDFTGNIIYSVVMLVVNTARQLKPQFKGTDWDLLNSFIEEDAEVREVMAEALADKVNNMVCEGFTAEEITKAVEKGTAEYGKDFTFYLDYGIREIVRRFKQENNVAIITIEGVEVGVKNIPELLEKIDLTELKLDRTVDEGMKAYIEERAENNFDLALRKNPEFVRINFYRTYLRYIATLQNLENRRKRRGNV